MYAGIIKNQTCKLVIQSSLCAIHVPSIVVDAHIHVTKSQDIRQTTWYMSVCFMCTGSLGGQHST